MGNEEIMQLRELKERLLKKVVRLRDRLKDREENGRPREEINFNTTLFSDDKNQKLSESIPSTRYKSKLCQVLGQVTGITFKDVDRKWLRDDDYIYTAKVITKTICFNIKLTVTLKELNDFKIKDITCLFTDDCHLLEISPWIQKIIPMKNFSLLMSAFSNYNENNILRTKILHDLELKQYSTIQQSTQENGGILVHMHSPVNTDEIYMTFQWTITFLDSTWRIEHFFRVKPTDIGMDFSEENRSLLKEFCSFGLTRNNLIQLWKRLCIAIDTYHARENV